MRKNQRTKHTYEIPVRISHFKIINLLHRVNENYPEVYSEEYIGTPKKYIYMYIDESQKAPLAPYSEDICFEHATLWSSPRDLPGTRETCTTFLVYVIPEPI